MHRDQSYVCTVIESCALLLVNIMNSAGAGKLAGCLSQGDLVSQMSNILEKVAHEERQKNR